MVKIEDELNQKLKGYSKENEKHIGGGQVGPLSMGSYSRASIKWIKGRYLTIRPSFIDKLGISTYITHIFWDEEAGHLAFSESGRTDKWFEQKGHVSISILSGHIYLVTNSEGQYRTIILGRSPKNNGLIDLLSTIAMTQGAHGVPIACPIVLMTTEEAMISNCGVLYPGDNNYENYREALNQASSGHFMQFVP
ncbi:transcriptional regulator [Sphingorhabdus lutea]|uniref:transcriptional regulator n=1 Tax=Sphingorhabdus lutea TaxID=1913578 RepID=UPI0012EC5CCC|nr:transcriptional regulator [Sphingorhabdus lutea]